LSFTFHFLWLDYSNNIRWRVKITGIQAYPCLSHMALISGCPIHFNIIVLLKKIF
jgi:hypothetical protein